MKDKKIATDKKVTSDLEGSFLRELEEKLENDINELKGISEVLKNRLDDLIDRQDALAEEHGGSNAKPSDIIALDIDGQEMFARRDTLTAVEGSRLEALFSGRWENQLLRDIKGRVLMDVDAYVFKKILEYLYMVKISDDIPPLPSVDEDKQAVFDAYVDFFALRAATDDSSEGDTKQSNEVDFESSSCSTKDQKALITVMKRKLDEMEQKLEAEESFVASFTKGANKDSTSNSDHSSQQSSYDILHPFEHMSVDSKQPIDTDLGIISLYVNGNIIKSKISTLCVDPTSKLAQDLTNDEWLHEHKMKTEDGKVCYLIEQPAYAFKELVEYLRLKGIIDDGNSKTIPNPNFGDATQEEYFVRMTKYFFSEASDIFQTPANPWLEDSKVVVDKGHMVKLKEWLASVNSKSTPKLLYRASRNGWGATDFHRMCDGKGATITVVKSSGGYMFGGYTDVAWSQSGGSCKSSRTSFLFSLKCHAGLGPLKMDVKSGNEASAVYHNSNYGPTFGGGQDLCIRFIPNQSNTNTSYTNIGHTYQLPDGVTGGHSLLTGASNFQVAEYEVFQV